ncbi:putative reverse transcriptase domain-containing protein [Tanacetum coccineum]|uniref:Reverse transcriptase domain-containing protein n=1 Tax=Tanacetum coccineum TaxID=301880 RepID=A0ABQ5ACZ4_9ASTR
MLVEMVDMMKKAPLGIIENILVRIDKFSFPSDFIIIDKNPNVTIILGRPFLATISTKINVFDIEISFGIDNDRVSYDMETKDHNFTTPTEKFFMIKSDLDNRPQSPACNNNQLRNLRDRSPDDSLHDQGDEYEFGIGKKGHMLDKIWEHCKDVHRDSTYWWNDHGFKDEERNKVGIEIKKYDPPYVQVPAARRQLLRPTRPVCYLETLMRLHSSTWATKWFKRLVAYAKCNHASYEMITRENELALDGDFLNFFASLLHFKCSEAKLKGVSCSNSTLPVYFISLMYNRDIIQNKLGDGTAGGIVFEMEDCSWLYGVYEEIAGVINIGLMMVRLMFIDCGSDIDSCSNEDVYVVPTGKDRFIVSAGRPNMVPAGRTIVSPGNIIFGLG